MEFKDKDVEIEPYFLGLWLGDGRNSDVRITNTDEDYSEKDAKMIQDELRRIGYL